MFVSATSASANKNSADVALLATSKTTRGLSSKCAPKRLGLIPSSQPRLLALELYDLTQRYKDTDISPK